MQMGISQEEIAVLKCHASIKMAVSEDGRRSAGRNGVRVKASSQDISHIIALNQQLHKLRIIVSALSPSFIGWLE
jgi:hypothetical protein